MLTFRYRITFDYPYILGCFKGAVMSSVVQRQSKNCYFATQDRGVLRRSEESRHKADTPESVDKDKSTGQMFKGFMKKIGDKLEGH